MKYFIVYYYTNRRGEHFTSSIGNAITTKRPFDWLAEMLKNKHLDEGYALIFWSEISDYDAKKITDLS